MNYYAQPMTMQHKGGCSPLTPAVQAAHCFSFEGSHNSSHVVVSEEGKDFHLAVEYYWLVDSLDGTKEFLVYRDELTVNVALAGLGDPVLGIALTLAINEFYRRAKGRGAWRVRQNAAEPPAQKRRSTCSNVATSRLHDRPNMDLFSSEKSMVDCVPIGLSVMYYLLDLGEVNVYALLVVSSEWDAAAGLSALAAAGSAHGKVSKLRKPNRPHPQTFSIVGLLIAARN